MSTHRVRTAGHQDDLFALGQVIATRSVTHAMQHSPELATLVAAAIGRHVSGDWGAVTPGDATANDLALIHRERILSVYAPAASVLPDSAGDDRIWVITEGDRSATTVLFPSDY